MATLTVVSSSADPELPVAFDIASGGIVGVVLAVTIVAIVVIARSHTTPLTKALLLLAALALPLVGALGSILVTRSFTRRQAPSTAPA